jgi:histidinol-phosphate/aromatic aminotransferase/cobyric acid decarboxylase-like protein
MNGVDVDLSGWEVSPLGLEIPRHPSLMPRDLNRYYADSGKRLAESKGRLVPALEILERRTIPPRELTLLPSTTAAIGVVLAYFKARGAERLLIDTPAYYAVLEAGARLGFHCELLPCINSSNGSVQTDIDRCLSEISNSKTVVWLHQPRYVVGSDLTCADILGLAGIANNGGGYLAIDEANDDTVPSLLAPVTGEHVFRIRSLVKQLGLNGLRLSVLFHAAQARDEITDIMWSVGAAMDWFSVASLETLVTPPALYGDLLRKAAATLDVQRRILCSIFARGPIRALPGTTGSLACLRIDWRSLPGEDVEKRERFIHHLGMNGIPGMLGSHIYMPKQYGFEHLRVNLFNETENMRRGCSAVSAFFSTASHSSDTPSDDGG